MTGGTYLQSGALSAVPHHPPSLPSPHNSLPFSCSHLLLCQKLLSPTSRPSQPSMPFTSPRSSPCPVPDHSVLSLPTGLFLSVLTLLQISRGAVTSPRLQAGHWSGCRGEEPTWPAQRRPALRTLHARTGSRPVALAPATLPSGAFVSLRQVTNSVVPLLARPTLSPTSRHLPSLSPVSPALPTLPAAQVTHCLPLRPPGWHIPTFYMICSPCPEYFVSSALLAQPAVLPCPSPSMSRISDISRGHCDIEWTEDSVHVGDRISHRSITRQGGG